VLGAWLHRPFWYKIRGNIDEDRDEDGRIWKGVVINEGS
jgi:hypothetical protein